MKVERLKYLTTYVHIFLPILLELHSLVPVESDRKVWFLNQALQQFTTQP